MGTARRGRRLRGPLCRCDPSPGHTFGASDPEEICPENVLPSSCPVGGLMGSSGRALGKWAFSQHLIK